MADAPVDVQSADSSPAAVVETPSLGDLSPAERQEWRKTGTKPTRTAKSATSPDSTAAADSSPAALADPGGETSPSSTPASEPGTPTRKKQNAESRKAELDAEIQERLTHRRQLEREVAELESKRQTARPADAPQPSASLPDPAFPEFEQWLTIPGNESKGLGAYTSAVVAFERQRATAQATVEQARAARWGTYAQRMTEAIKDDPNWQSKVAPEILATKTIDQLDPTREQAHMGNVLAQEISESPVPYAVQRYLTDHPDEWRWLTSQTVPYVVIRHVASLSARLWTPSASPMPAVKTTTDAPPPIPQIGTRPHAPHADELLSAATSGDPRRYKDTANAIDIARMRARGR